MTEIGIILAVVAAIIFLKGFDRIAGRSPKAEKSNPAKPCPFCAEDINTAAIVCKHCGRDVPA